MEYSTPAQLSKFWGDIVVPLQTNERILEEFRQALEEIKESPRIETLTRLSLPLMRLFCDILEALKIIKMEILPKRESVLLLPTTTLSTVLFHQLDLQVLEFTRLVERCWKLLASMPTMADGVDVDEHVLTMLRNVADASNLIILPTNEAE